jgi:hypothetical protein
VGQSQRTEMKCNAAWRRRLGGEGGASVQLVLGREHDEQGEHQEDSVQGWIVNVAALTAAVERRMVGFV